MLFTVQNRINIIHQIENESFDIIIIGGGITGAGILLECAVKGIRAILFEKDDFAQGTSSRSTKLIHGGLRYLKQLEFGLVRETGLERAVIYRNAPHVVHAERMLLPIRVGGSLGKTSVSIALWLYDLLAKVPKAERKKMISASDTLQVEPLLNKDKLIGGGLYYEYRTDDSRLTIEVLKTAVSKGLSALNYCEVKNLTYHNGKINGVEIWDKIANTKKNIQAKCVINATGPWVDSIRAIDKSLEKKRLHLTKGVHIVVEHATLPLKQSVYFDTDDNRMIFAIPRFDKTYIGTTDTNYKGTLENPICNEDDIAYLIQQINRTFANILLTKNDVVSTWAGLRPLIHEDGKSPSELSRKDEIFISNSGLISMAGGKLTGYRKMAERVVLKACSLHAISASPRSTKECMLSGGNVGNSQDFEKFIQQKTGETRQLHWNEHDVKKLAYKYGSNMDKIIELGFEMNIRNNGYQSLLSAEYTYCLLHESVFAIDDFITRRSGISLFEPEKKLVAESIIHSLGAN